MYATCTDLPTVTEETVAAIEAEIGTDTPTGLVAHVAGPYPGGMRIIDVWETEADAQRFQTELLGPALNRVVGSDRGNVPVTTLVASSAAVRRAHVVLEPTH